MYTIFLSCMLYALNTKLEKYEFFNFIFKFVDQPNRSKSIFMVRFQINFYGTIPFFLKKSEIQTIEEFIGSKNLNH